MRLIDANALIRDGWRLERHGVANSLLEVKSLADVPTIEAEPVRHGKFVKATPISEPYCDQCGKSPKIMFGLLSNYCPNCGAKMDLEGE